MTDANVEIMPEVFDLETIEAPAALEPVCTREQLLRPPDWRYQAACQYLSDMSKKHTPEIPTDPIVQYIIRYLRAEGNARRYVLRCWPSMSDAMYYGMEAKNSAIANMLDTCLIKGWSIEEAAMAGCPVRKDVYELYAKAFFDLTGVRAIHAWMQDFVFSPAMSSANGGKLRARLMAYYGQGTAGLNISVTGHVSQAESDMVKKLMKNERSKQLFDYVMKKTRLPLDLYVPIMETALKSMSDREFQEHMKDRDEAGSLSLEELAAGIEEGVRAFSQSELDNVSRTGVDFTAQYTKTITGSNDNDKETVKR